MARPLRTSYSGVYFYATSRGNDRAVIFEIDFDREIFLNILNPPTIGMTGYYTLCAEKKTSTISRWKLLPEILPGLRSTLTELL